MALALCIVMCMGLFCSCNGLSAFDERNKTSLPDYPLNPNDSTTRKEEATLYYRFLDTDYLVPMKVRINTSSNERAEDALLHKLFSGDELGGMFTTAIPEDVEIINILESGDTLFITLSNALINRGEYKNEEDVSVAVCQIINTVTDFSGKSVQIMIDRNGTGSGERIKYADLGFDATYDEQYDYAAAFNFIKQAVITPTAILNCVLSKLHNSELENINTVFAAGTQRKSVSSSDINRFADKYHVSSFSISREVIETEAAFVYCKIEFSQLETGENIVFNGYIEMPRYDSLYKVPYDQLVRAAGGKA